MRLRTIALDYDGTIAHAGRLDRSVRDAIAYARARGVTVLLVTGRILADLRAVAGDLHFVDAVVGENGAFLHFPDTGRTAPLAPVVDPRVTDELRRRGVPFQTGAHLIDADAVLAPRLLEVIRDLEVPLVLAFNQNSVMVLPQGVSKATGLQQALTIMRLSARNAVALGDAENDYELLRAAEVGVAVGWGSAALQAAADVVLTGRGPGDAAPYLRALADAGVLPIPRRVRRHLLLGATGSGQDRFLAVRGGAVLVTGESRNDRTRVASLLCEQMILQGYSVCVIDPGGHYASLEGSPGVTVRGEPDRLRSPQDLLPMLRYPDRNVVADLSRLPRAEKHAYVRALLPTLAAVRQRVGLPHRIVVDEAHQFLDSESLARDLEPDGTVLVTDAPSRLPAALLDTSEAAVVTRLSRPAEIATLQARYSREGQRAAGDWSTLSRLDQRTAVVLPSAGEDDGLEPITLASRLAPHDNPAGE